MSERKKKFEALSAAVEREADPILKSMLEVRRDSAYAEWMQEETPGNEKFLARPAQPDALTSATTAGQKSIAERIELPGNERAVSAAQAPTKQPTYPAFDAKRDEYFRREAAAMGKPLAPELLSTKPDTAAQQSVQQEVQPAAPPQAPQGTQPLSFAGFRQLAGGGGGGVSRGAMMGALGNADAARQASAAAFGAEKDAILKRGAQQEADGKQLGETMAAFAQQMKASDEEHQAYLMQARERIGGLIQESRAAAEEFRAATREQGFMQSLSSGGRVGAAISLALGALGGGLTGQGGNAALDVLKFRVDEDLRNRALNISAKGQALDAVDGLLQRNMQIFGDEVSAREATRAAIFDSLKLEVQRQAAISGGVDAANNAQQITAGMDAEQARAYEVLANQQYMAMQKAARSGGMSNLKLLKEYQAYLKNEVGIQTDETTLEQMRGKGGEPDIYSEEGKRKADRTARLYDKLKPIDATIEQGKLLLEKVGVPRVDTRARAGIDEFFSQSDSLPTKVIGATVGLPARILSDDENAQIAAMLSFTNSAQKAVDSRVSNQDFNNARDLLVRQGPLIGQDALVKIVRQMVEQAEIMRKDALASDELAAGEYEKEQAKRRAELNTQRGGRGIPSYGTKQ